MMLRVWLLIGVAACGRASAIGARDDDGVSVDAPGSTADASPDPGGDAGPDAPPDGPVVPADPFTIDPAKQPMPFAQLVTYFGPGEVVAGVGGYQVRLRSRAACNEVTGCTPWIDPGTVTLMESNGTQRVPSASGAATLKLDTLSSPPKISIEFAGSPVRFSCGSTPQAGTPSWSCSTYGTGLLWFSDQYLGHPRLDNTTLIEWRGIIATDGTYHFVSRLASDLGTAVTGKNNLQQMAIYGAL
jgi:hypothetical protein